MTNLNSSASGGYLTAGPPTSPQDDALIDVVSSAIVRMLDITPSYVRPRWQPIPAPELPPTTDWCSLGLMTEMATFSPEIIHDPTLFPNLAGTPQGGDVLIRREKLSLLITFYGPNSNGNAASMRDAFFIPQNWEALRTLGIVLYDVDHLSNIPELVNNQWIARSDIDVQMFREVKRTFEVFTLLSGKTAVTNNPGG